MRPAAPTHVVEKIKTVIPAINQVGRIAHVAICIGKTNCRKPSFAGIARHALQTRPGCEVEAAILTFLTTGNSQKAKSKFIDESRGEDMDFADGGVSRSCRDAVTKAGGRRLVEVGVPVRLECRHVRVGQPREHVILASGGVIHAQRELILVIPQAR